MALKFGAPPFLLKHPFRTDRVVEALDVPMLIFHGTRDTVVPVSHGRQLHKLAQRATYVEYNSDHNDFPGEGNEDAYWREIQAFLVRPGVLNAPKPLRPLRSRGANLQALPSMLFSALLSFVVASPSLSSAFE